MLGTLTDDTIRELLTGVIGNGLWSLVAQSSIKLVHEIRSLVSPPQPPILAAIRTASEQLADAMGQSVEQRQHRLVAYLKSPELESIVRQLFATSLVGAKESATMEAARETFFASLSKYLDMDPQRIRPFGEAVLNGLLLGVDEALQAAIDKNVLSAHEAKSASRHRLLLDEIACLKEKVTFLTTQNTLDIGAILLFEAKYREQVACVHSHIKPPHLESGRRVPINDLFVAPRISWVPRRKTEEPETMSLSDFLARLYRAVLLGNPGGGKSTASLKICFDLATNYAERLLAGREVTPAIVVLREFGSQRKISNCSIVQFLEQQANSRYQVAPPAHAFEYMLLNGRMIVIFDGLDELLDSSYRQEITTTVEAFCKLYPSVPVLVTSREVGYEQAPLNEKTFDLFQLAPFDDKQVREYADKWFSMDEDYSAEQKTQRARAFFFDSALVPDLRSNPLMLGLMCNLYRAEGYIPRNRPEVYGKCSVMLFERWDKSRDIVVPLSFEEHIRPAMQDLAFWIYSDEGLQGGVTEHDLIQRTGNYLSKWVFDDVHKARSASSDFIGFCRGRAWVFTDTGTTKEGERLFQFTHRTFLEYFTACYLVSVYPTPAPLVEFLLPKVLKGEWDVVAQLAFQIQSKQVHGAADDLLTRLMATQFQSDRDRWNALSFAERALEFLVPSPKVRRAITRAGLDFWLKFVRRYKSASWATMDEPAREIIEHVGNLLLVTAENRDTIADEMEIFLAETIDCQVLEVAALGAGLALDLTYPLHDIEVRRSVTSDIQEYWEKLSARIVAGKLMRIRTIAGDDWAVALRCYWRELISLSECVARFGVPFLVASVRSAALGNVWFTPPGYMLVNAVLGLRWNRSGSQPERLKRVSELERMADNFLSAPLPWFRREHMNGPLSRLYFGARRDRDDRAPNPPEISPDAIFSILCLLAVDFECSSGRRNRAEIEATLAGERRIPDVWKSLFFGRLSGGADDAVAALDKLGFTSGQTDLLAKWVRCEVDFVQPRRRLRRSSIRV